MTVDLDLLRAVRLSARQTLTARDTMLYALGVGLGADPLDERQLRFVQEQGPLGLQALPTQAITLTYPDLLAAYQRAGVAPHRVLHGEQQFELARPLPVQAELVGETRVTQLVDKGPGRGLLVYYRTEVRDARTGEDVATLTSGSFCIDEGGCGAAREAGPIERRRLPDRPPDHRCELPTLPQAALIYRLSGDWNPLHAVPAVARAAGFDRPPLHGRCTFGVAGHAILRSACGHDPGRLRSMSARFTAPVFPGESLRTELWQAPGGVLFRTIVVGRNVVALDNGFAAISQSAPSQVPERP